jgi:hypothetical protein
MEEQEKMQINIPSDADALVRDKAAAAGFPSVDQYVLSLILREEDEATDEPLTQEELDESLAMLERGMEDVNAGRTQPAKEALEEIAKEFGLKIRR